jgi:hypothetical protein
MYGQRNHCYFHCPDGSIDCFLQEEGFPQGHPLAPALSCLVLLHLLFKPLNDSLTTRASSRVHHQDFGDDGRGSCMAVMAYLDDATLFPPYIDLPVILQFFYNKPPPLGIFLSLGKF